MPRTRPPQTIPWLERVLALPRKDHILLLIRHCQLPGASIITSMAFASTYCQRTGRPAPWQNHPNITLPDAEYRVLHKRLSVGPVPVTPDDNDPRYVVHHEPSAKTPFEIPALRRDTEGPPPAPRSRARRTYGEIEAPGAALRRHGLDLRRGAR